MPNSDAPWTWGNCTIFAGITKLSQLVIDSDKNWLAHLIKNLSDPVDDQDAATRAFVLAQIASEADTRAGDDSAEATARAAADLLHLLLTGGTMTGNIAMSGKLVTGLGAPVADNDAARKVYIDGKLVTVSFANSPHDNDVVYLNDSGKLRLVVVVESINIAELGTKLEGNAVCFAYVGVADPPDTLVGTLELTTYLYGLANASNQITDKRALAFIVPPGYHYAVYSSYGGDAGVAVYDWTEYDLF